MSKKARPAGVPAKTKRAKAAPAQSRAKYQNLVTHMERVYSTASAAERYEDKELRGLLAEIERRSAIALSGAK